MRNYYQVYNAKNIPICTYGLGWNLAEIFNNEYHLTDKEAVRVELVIEGKVVSTITKSELILSLTK